MKAKKGISLIVLVITIIVIIILAAAVLLSINKNNPIENANKAVVENDKGEVQSAVTLLMGSVMADIQQSAKLQATNMLTGEEKTEDEKEGKTEYVAIATKSGNDYTYAVSIVTNETTPKKIYKTADGYVAAETAPEGGTEVKLTADTLDIGAETLAKYTINANGKVSK